MFHCEQCGADFMNSDEFNAHTSRHNIQEMEQWRSFMKAFMAVPGQFLAIQLTSIAAASNKSADEVLSLYREILAKLESESQGRGI
jgi:hypothetical protein